MKKIKNKVEEKSETHFAYRSIAEAIYKDFIENNKLAMGDALPTEQELRKHYKVSRTTVRRGVKELVERGLVYTVQGSGAFVDGKKQEWECTNLIGFNRYAQELDIIPDKKVLEFKVEEASEEISKILGLKKGDSVYMYKRIFYFNSDPVQVESSFWPVALFPDLSMSVLEGSKYQYIEEIKKMVIGKCRLTIEPCLLDSDTAELLQMKANTPIDRIREIGFLEDGTVFEYTEAVKNSNKFLITFEIDRKKNRF